MELKTRIVWKRYGGKDEEPRPKRAKPKEDIKAAEEETHFYNLFTAVLDFLIKWENINETDISKAIRSIINSFHFADGNKFSDVNYKRTPNMCGYLFRYGKHGAGLARSRILDAVNHCDVLKDCFKSTELNIICLGGGPGPDMVGLCSALFEIDCCSTLNLIVVDNMRRWGSCLNLVEFFLREGTYGNVSKIFRHLTANLSFVQASLPGNRNSDEKYFRCLKEADVIVIQKLLSILKIDVQKEIIKSLSNEIKSEALLLYIGSPFLADLWFRFDILYQSDLDVYSASSPSWRFGQNDNVSSKAQIVVLRKTAST